MILKIPNQRVVARERCDSHGVTGPVQCSLTTCGIVQLSHVRSAVQSAAWLVQQTFGKKHCTVLWDTCFGRRKKQKHKQDGSQNRRHLQRAVVLIARLRAQIAELQATVKINQVCGAAAKQLQDGRPARDQEAASRLAGQAEYIRKDRAGHYLVQHSMTRLLQSASAYVA